MDHKRIRLIFEDDDDILSESQKSEGLNRSWLLLNTHHQQQQHATTIYDVVSHILQAFKLHESCPNGLILSVSGFVLPAFESTCILKDNEVVRVRKRGNVLRIDGNEAADQLEKLGGVEQQPRNTDILLLANGDGGHGSEVPDEKDDDGLLENSHRKKQKRKAPEKLRDSKKKKHSAEKPCQGVVLTKKKLPSEEEEKTDSGAEDYLENKEESVRFREAGDASLPGMKRNAKVQDNIQVTEDAQITSEEIKKVPSRSARRTYAKRRLLREMLNAACKSEGLRNWKEDHAKTERNKLESQLEGPKNWKKQRAITEKIELDDQPKGLLHWKQSHQSNPVVKGKKREQRNQIVHSHKHPSENGDVADLPSGDGQKEPYENGVTHEQPNRKNDDEHEQPNEIDGDVQERPYQNGDAPEPSNQDGHVENEVVPIMIRPGHIRFEPLEKDEAVQHNHVPSDNFQWNGITSKKKGQKWGIENTGRNEYRNSKDYSESLGSSKEKQMDEIFNFDKLPPLPSMPKEGDLIAYRVVELSSSWAPELSAYRVGKVSLYNAESNQIVLVAVSEFPIVFQKTDEDEDELPDNSLYKEDGILEIEFSSLVDVRIVKSSEPRNGAITSVTDGLTGKENAPKTLFPSSNGDQTKAPGPESGGVNVWDQINQALNTKKEELSKDNSCGQTPNKVQRLQDSIAKNVSPLAADSQEKNTKKVQLSQENSQRKQSSVDKSWTYKALRGSALGPTMALLRSKQDI